MGTICDGVRWQISNDNIEEHMASCLSASRKKAGRQEGREEVERRQRRMPFSYRKREEMRESQSRREELQFSPVVIATGEETDNIRKETFSCCLGLLRKIFVYSGYPVYTGYGVQVEEREKDHHCHSFPFSLYVCLEWSRSCCSSFLSVVREADTPTHTQPTSRYSQLVPQSYRQTLQQPGSIHSQFNSIHSVNQQPPPTQQERRDREKTKAFLRLSFYAYLPCVFSSILSLTHSFIVILLHSISFNICQVS